MWAQVTALSWPEFCRLWKDYIDAMSHALRDANTTTDSAAAQRLARLVYETGVEAAAAGWSSWVTCAAHNPRSSNRCARACAHHHQILIHSAPINIICCMRWAGDGPG